MIRFRFLLTVCLLALLPLGSWSQELLVNVSIDDSRIQSDKSVFDDMQQNISRYLNFQKWGKDEFEAKERIRCNLQIVVKDRPAPDQFSCIANLQVYRPVYNTTYETLILNISDDNFSFRYVPFQQMTYVDNTFNDNLTALLNFYAFLILGMDYDSFGPEAGMPYFRKAQETVNLASSGAVGRNGWRSGEDNRNRYWLIENIMNSSYKAFHTVIYKYHRQGMDQMESNPENARKAILDAVQEMQRLNRQNPLLVINKTFLDCKDNELVKVFQNAFVNDKQAFLEVMNELDPSNMGEYNKVME